MARVQLTESSRLDKANPPSSNEHRVRRTISMPLFSHERVPSQNNLRLTRMGSLPMPDCNAALAQASDEFRWYVIGFVLLSVQGNVEVVERPGSGTLVTINGMRGVLTAAHVVDALREKKEVGIVTFHASSKSLQKLMLPMDHVQYVQLGQKPWSSNGPDLAFLTLPMNVADSLGATNSFYNLSAKRAKALNSEFPAGKHFSCIAGVVHERTITTPLPDIAANKALFAALCEPGAVSNQRSEDGFDLMDFDAAPRDDGAGPRSYGGVSGAALWRVYCEEDTEGEPTRMTKLWLHGVAFYEQTHDNRTPTITCHGHISVFDKLLSKVALP